MKKSTLAAQGGAGIVALALIAAVAQADSVRYGDLNNLDIDMADAALVATQAIAGGVVEAELEMEDARAIWEIEIVNEANRLVTVEVDGQTGEILSTETDDDTELYPVDSISLNKAIDIVTALENGALVEAELERENGELIWEVETLNEHDQETKFRIHAETGEVLQ